VDSTAVAALAKLATMDADAKVRLTAVDSLGKIGGNEAVDVLKKAALEDRNEEVRARSVGALGNLALKEQASLVFTRGQIRTRGAVRTRGAQPSKAVSQEAADVLQLLEQVRGADTSEYVRDIADESLSFLGQTDAGRR